MSRDLKSNGFLSDVMKDFSTAITYLFGLCILSLAGNKLGSDGLKALMEGVTRLTGLTRLSLSRNQLSADDCARVCGAAAGAGMTQLCALEAEGNGFSAASVVGCEGWREAGLSCLADNVFFPSSFSMVLQYALSVDRASFAYLHRFYRHPLLHSVLLRRLQSSGPSPPSVDTHGLAYSILDSDFI